MTTGLGATSIGDLLVPLAGPPPDGLPVRTGASVTGWEPHDGVATVAVGPGWRGYGCIVAAGPTWEAWLIGEPSARSIVAAGWGPDLDPDRLVPALRGSFLLVARHVPTGAWHAWTDRFGTVHGYHAHRPADGDEPAHGALGTFSPAVGRAVGATGLDWEALTGWCAFGFFPRDTTHRPDVKVLPPATHTRFGPDGAVESSERWWDWTFAPDRTRSYDATVDAYANRFEAVLAGELSDAVGGLAVPISGGLDSRSTVAALTRPGEAPDPALWSFSYGWGPESIETAIAGQLSRLRGLPFEAFTIGPYLFDQLDRVLDATEGMSDISPPRQSGVVDEIGHHAHHLVAAHWGDVWLDDMHLDPAQALVDRVLYLMSKPGRAWLLEEVCRPNLPAGTDVDELLRAAVVDGLAEVEHLGDTEFQVKAFKTDHWSHRWTLSSIRAYRSGVVPLLPYYDPDLADLFATIPSDWVAGRRLQLDHLRRRAPDLAKVTWQATGSDLFDAGRSALARFPGRAARALRRRRRPDTTPLRNWQVQFAGEGADRLRALLLDPGARIHGLVAPERIAALLDQLGAEPTGANGYTVSMLLTLAAWLDRHG